MNNLMVLISLVFLSAAFLGACSPAELEPAGSENPPAAGTDVYVNEILINIMESFPVQVSVTVRGDLADGCVTLNDLTPVAVDGGWQIEIDSSRDPDMMCTEALVPFEETVSLDVAGLAAGTYTVSAGDQSTSFTLDMDNVVPEATAPQPVITLERTPCFGFCPVYTVTIYSDGTAVYAGQDFVEVKGEQTEIIGVEGVNYLVNQFVDVGYMVG